MVKRSGMLLALVVAGMMLVGCQSRVARERDETIAQNKKLQKDLDDARERAERQQQQSNLVGPAPVAPPTQPVTPVAPEKPNVPPPPKVENVTPPVIPGTEVTSDVAAGTVTVNISGDVLFSSGQADLRDTSKKTLDSVVSAIKDKYPGKKIRVEGHTDSDPIKKSKWASNEALSEARADSVKKYLVSKGIDGSQITTKGLGATAPKGEAKAKNRRVEIVVITR